MGNFAFALAGDGTETLELDIYSVIAQSSWWYDSISASQVRRKLKENSKAKLIKIRVHSDGGDVFEAQAIYAELQAHGARVEVDIMGLAASAATLVAMAGDTIRITEGAWFMVHNAWGMAMGGPEELEDWADVLRKVSGTFADIYSKRSGLDRKKVVQLMDAETWMTAAEAKAFGFVDEVIPAKAKAAASANEKRALDSVRRSVARSIAAGDYEKVPEALRAALPAPESPALEGDPAIETPTNPEPSPAPPAPEPATPQLQLALGPTPEVEETDMQFPKNILKALSLAEDADEAAVEAAIKKLQASARAGVAIEALLGTSGDAAVGAVRALKESSEANAGLHDEVEKLKVVNSRRDFEALREQGCKDKKLSPAQAKFYTEKFDKAVKADENGIPASDGNEVVNDLRGFLAVSHRQGATAVVVQQPTPDGSSPSGVATHNGKAFEDMTPAARLKLKGENVELYNTLREDAQARGAL
jgi:ATP-dependent Clp protease protease subunit